MHAKSKGSRPRLDRRNAIKGIDYEASASTSTPSCSFNDQSTPRTRSLDFIPLSERTSFRIEGTDGEFDQICRSLGLSPEDFAIPTAAWEARRCSSASNSVRSSRLTRSGVLDADRLADSFATSAVIRNDDELEDCLDVAGVGQEARARIGDEIETADENLCKDGCRGIKGARPPRLAAPESVVDHLSKPWDLDRSFSHPNDEDSGSPEDSPTDSEDFQRTEDVGNAIENEERSDDNLIDGAGLVPESFSDSHSDCNEERSDKNLIDGAGLVPESFSDSHSDCNEDDDPDTLKTESESLYTVSAHASFRCSIKNWQKGDFLGSGSFGTVYEGYTDDGFFFAVKEVSLLATGNQGQQSIFQLEQEISLLSQFEHENIVRYLGTDKGDSKLYIFLELVPKGSLASLYRKYQLRDTQVSAYTKQILSGLHYLHLRDVVHRDIKCANILVDVNGSVKLADFGLAKAAKLNDIKSCKGTPFWMAPEMQALFRIGRGERPPIPNSLSKDAQDFICKCLQVNPTDRPTAAELLEHPFLRTASPVPPRP
nr:mitogen-activated protein kinase kinase kinase 1-like [Ipomoea batatas]